MLKLISVTFTDEHRPNAWAELNKLKSSQENWVYEQQRDQYDPEEFSAEMINYSEDSTWRKIKKCEETMDAHDRVTFEKWVTVLEQAYKEEIKSASNIKYEIEEYGGEANVGGELASIEQIIFERHTAKEKLKLRLVDYPASENSLVNMKVENLPSNLTAVMAWFVKEHTDLAIHIWEQEAADLMLELKVSVPEKRNWLKELKRQSTRSVCL